MNNHIRFTAILITIGLVGSLCAMEQGTKKAKIDIESLATPLGSEGMESTTKKTKTSDKNLLQVALVDKDGNEEPVELDLRTLFALAKVNFTTAHLLKLVLTGQSDRIQVQTHTGFKELLKTVPFIIKRDSKGLVTHLGSLAFVEKRDEDYGKLLNEADFLGIYEIPNSAFWVLHNLIERNLSRGGVKFSDTFLQEMDRFFQLQANYPHLKIIDIEHKDKYGRTLLILASLHGHTNLVEFLLKYGAQVNAVDNELNTALMEAAKAGYIDTMTALLKAGAQPNLQNNSGATALHIATKEGPIEAVEFLINAKVDVNVQDSNGNTVLHTIAGSGENQLFREIVKILINAGAQVNLKNNNGETTLDEALEGSYKDDVRLILKAGGTSDLRSEDYIGWIADAARDEDKELLKLLLKTGNLLE